MGDVLTGKVTGIQPYGAFVALDEHTQGLVHISEITYGFVKDVSEFLSVGEDIQVKVLDVDAEQKKLAYRFANYKKRHIVESEMYNHENHCKIELMKLMRMGSKF